MSRDLRHHAAHLRVFANIAMFAESVVDVRELRGYLRPMQPSSRSHRPEQPKVAIRRLREAAGLSQAELARRAGISRSLVCEIESGTRSLTPATRTKIATVLALPVIPVPAVAA